MKKLFPILILSAALMFAAPESKSQVIVKAMTSSLTNAVDSIRCISTTANYLYISNGAVSNGYTGAVFQSTVTRVSAAIGGSIFLQGSVDGTNWHTATYAAGDTNTVADAASQVLKIEVKPVSGINYKHYRLKCTGASGDTMTVKSKFCGRY